MIVANKFKQMRDYVVRILCLAIILLFSCQLALGAESAFYSQCHKLLPTADEFAGECLRRARPFSRTFYPNGRGAGEFESYSTHFQKLDAPSHFLLGCVLDFKHKLNFIGIFYSPKLLDMSNPSEYQIVFVDPSDNVGIEIDGVQNTLLAIRQFVTDAIPPRLIGRPKNCETQYIETTETVTATAMERFRKIGAVEFEYCMRTYCRSDSYSFFFGIHQTPLIYTDDDSVLIDEEGVLMIKTKHLERTCSGWKKKSASAENIIYEMCKKN